MSSTGAFALAGWPAGQRPSTAICRRPPSRVQAIGAILAVSSGCGTIKRKARRGLAAAFAMPSDLEVRSLRKEYPHPAGSLRVLDGLDLALPRGEALAVMGPSGSGKSTLLYILGSLEVPTAGTVRICGQDPFALAPAALARFRNRSVGFVFQEHHLLPQCTSLENVLVPTLPGGGSSPAAVGRAKDLLDRVGLAERMDRLPSELSGGERQRVAIARALINSPPVVLADEPTGNLDRRSARRVGGLLMELQRESNVLLIAVTHSTDFAARFPERAELVDGRLERHA